VKDKFWLKE